MDLLAILGILIVIALAWWVLQQFGGHLPPLILTICYVVLVIVAVVMLCQVLGIPLPLRGSRV